MRITIAIVFYVLALMPNLYAIESLHDSCLWNQNLIRYYVEKPVNGLESREYKKIIKRSFRQWTGLVNIKVREVRKYNKADVAFIWIDDNNNRNWPGVKTPAVADFPGNKDCLTFEPRGLNIKLVIYTNTKFSWPLTETNSWSLSGDASSYDFETITLHEIGHLMGMEHCTEKLFWREGCDSGSVMGNTIDEGQVNRTLSKRDKQRIQELYSVRLSKISE